ncbi:hypothetical protein BJV74DRAFT_887367 [Russula compacta]|nr:hypothetical protein BJV74DRAFT_887367 [Russula compacta]
MPPATPRPSMARRASSRICVVRPFTPNDPRALPADYLFNHVRPLICTTSLSNVDVVLVSRSFKLLQDGTASLSAHIPEHSRYFPEDLSESLAGSSSYPFPADSSPSTIVNDTSQRGSHRFWRPVPSIYLRISSQCVESTHRRSAVCRKARTE